MSLVSTQANLWAAVRSRPEPPETRASFRATQGLSVEAALEVYRTAYWVRQVGALQETFSVTCQHLGLQAFNQLASRFLTRHPSRVWALERLGENFPDWVGQHGGNAALARAEYARLECVMAPDVTSVGPEALNEVDFVNVRLQFVPYFRAVAADEATLGLLGRGSGVGLAIWRVNHAVYERSLAAPEWQALTFATQNQPLGLVLEPLMTADPHDAARCVAQWFVDGWVKGISP